MKTKPIPTNRSAEQARGDALSRQALRDWLKAMLAKHFGPPVSRPTRRKAR